MENTEIIKKEIQEAIAELKLDLTGLTIYTSAGNGIYGIAPLIALSAKAEKVYAILEDSSYGTFSEIKKNTMNFVKKLNLKTDALEIVHKKDFQNYSELDIVTNLGHVRPLNQKFLAKLKKETVISYMCEAWEFRKEDLDLEYCRARGIGVYGLNEEYPAIDCFKETGLIALKLIFEARVSLPNARIAIVSRDKFGREIVKVLKLFTKNIFLLKIFSKIPCVRLRDLDLLIIADYLYDKEIIGRHGLIKPNILKKASPCVKIIQYAGRNNLQDILRNGLDVYPSRQLFAQRMALTLGDISYRSIIRLYAGGLKVGEVIKRKNTSYLSLVQPIT